MANHIFNSNDTASEFKYDIIPDGTNTRDIGSNSVRWKRLWSIDAVMTNLNTDGVTVGNSGISVSNSIQVKFGSILSGFTTPSGQIADLNLVNNGTGPTAVHTVSDGTANASPTNNVLIESGNKTAGTGGSGDIRITTGTSSGGTRGQIVLNASLISATANIVPSVDNSRTLGNSSFMWATLYVGDVRRQGGSPLILSSDGNVQLNQASNFGLVLNNPGGYVKMNDGNGIFTIQGSGGGAGTDISGGEMAVKSGTATGNGTAIVGLYIVRPGQGTGGTVRNPALAFSVSGANEARHYEPGTSNYVGLSAPTSTTSYSVTLPSVAPSAGKILVATSTTATTWQAQGTLFSEAVVGSAAQVTAGLATHSSLQAAHDAIASPGRIIMLLATIAESVTWTKSNIKLEGGGRGSMLTGNLTVNNGAVGNLFRAWKVNGNVTFQAGADGNFLSDSWISNTGALTDGGAGNQTNYIQET